MLAKFNMVTNFYVNTSFASYFLCSATQCLTYEVEKSLMFSISYENAIDILMYLIECTRTDIAFAGGKMSRYISYLDKVHWEILKCILRYLKGFTWHGLLLDAKAMNAKLILEYVDVDHEFKIRRNQRLDLLSHLQVKELVEELLLKSEFL